MAIPAIAKRMGCSRSAIVSINRKFQVREYAGRRSTWQMIGQNSEQTVVETSS
jgi:hypothetical protein